MLAFCSLGAVFVNIPQLSIIVSEAFGIVRTKRTEGKPKLGLRCVVNAKAHKS